LVGPRGKSENGLNREREETSDLRLKTNVMGQNCDIGNVLERREGRKRRDKSVLQKRQTAAHWPAVETNTMCNSQTKRKKSNKTG